MSIVSQTHYFEIALPKTEEQIKRNAEAFNRMVNNSRLGRQKKKKNYDNLGVF